VLMPTDLQRLTDSSVPSPEEIVLWHHFRIYLKLARAIAARERAESGRNDAADAANGYAKVALVSIQRSRHALVQIKRRGVAAQPGTLAALLEQIERGIERRFPDARAFVRLGLDVPVS
jgi:hypothetical protein